MKKETDTEKKIYYDLMRLDDKWHCRKLVEKM